MAEEFIVKAKQGEKKEDDDYVIFSIRVERDLRDRFDELSAKSKHSRNKLISMAMEYALLHLKYVDEKGDKP